jgi:hypothetical protein
VKIMLYALGIANDIVISKEDNQHVLEKTEKSNFILTPSAKHKKKCSQSQIGISVCLEP